MLITEPNWIIKSLLDTDLYKLSMQKFVLDMYPDAIAEYKFTNRGRHDFGNPIFIKRLKEEISKLSHLQLKDYEKDFLMESCPYLGKGYVSYLKNFRFRPHQVKIDVKNGFELTIKGPWLETILFEVPLMAIISELYYQTQESTDYNSKVILEEQRKKAWEKIDALTKNGCNFADFGTRRRRSYRIQKLLIETFERYKNSQSTFSGTSNVHFARIYGLKPKGTMAHEIVMGMQSLESINHCNYYAMQKWKEVYKGSSLGIALADTIGTDMFLLDFNKELSSLYQGVRQDSGDPFEFTDKMVSHYKKLRINPLSKIIIFSDSLNVEKAIKIKEYCDDKIQCSFGIGTFFTGNFGPESPPLNMVIKLHSINNFPVCKISDDDGKETGNKKSIETMKWIIHKHLN